MKTGFRNNWHFYVSVFAVIFVTLACQVAGYNINLTDESATPSSARAECIKGVIPGQTSRTQVLATLGNPLATEQSIGLDTLFYASAIYGQLNSIVVQNDMVVLLSVVQPEESLPKWSNIKAQHGEPTHTAFSNYSKGTKTFAFPEEGISYIADETMDRVFVQNCFVPMSLENYVTTYGNFLPTEDPFIQ